MRTESTKFRERHTQIKFCSTSRTDPCCNLAMSPGVIVRLLFASGTQRRTITTPRDAPWRATATHGSRPTADGTLTEKTSKRRPAPRRTRSLQSLPRRWRRWRWTWRGGRSAQGKGLRLVHRHHRRHHHHHHRSGVYYGRKGCLFLYLRGRILE